jgi:hypothetical protein
MLRAGVRPQRAEFVIHRDTADDWKQISLIDDFGGKIMLSAEQLRILAAAAFPATSS